MNHSGIMGLRVNQNVTSWVAHEPAAATPTKLPRALATNNAPPSNVSMSLSVVEAVVLKGADPAVRHIHLNKWFHQILCKDVVPQFPAKHLQTQPLSVFLVDDERILQAPVQYKCQAPMPPLIQVKGYCIISTLLVYNVHTPHVLLVLQHDGAGWKIHMVPLHPPRCHAGRINRIQGC
jgi:hypothetical protein